MIYKLKIFTDFNGQVEKLWDEFEKNSKNHCFQSFYWLKNWHLNLNSAANIKIFNVLVYQNERIIMLLPLCVEKKNGVKFLQWQGGDRSDYMGGLLDANLSINKESFDYIWTKIKREIKLFDIVYFQRQPKKLLDKVNPFFTYLKNNEDYVTNSINLERDFNLYVEKNIKSKFISDTKRRINGLKKIGNLNFQIIDNTQILEVKSTIEKILNEKILRLKKFKLKNPFNSEAKKFYLNFDNRFFKNGYLHLSKLKISEVPISYHWGVVYKNRFYHLLPTITESEYNKYAPGRIHLQNLIQWSTLKNILKFDFTIGDEEYKKDWVNYRENLYSHLEINNYLYIFYYFFLYIKILIKSFIKKIN